LNFCRFGYYIRPGTSFTTASGRLDYFSNSRRAALSLLVTVDR
jgi:hypothetical protein